jgi:putative transposase
MPGGARLSLPGIPWHIIQRGNNRSVCFYADEDYHLYLDTLKEQAEKFGCLVHAYVLMTNHVHLLLTPEKEGSASLLMKHFGQRYVQYINRTYKRSGTLWEGRFRSCLTQSEDYVLACYRYIELNPVRANMVDHPRHYPWSSYCANAEGKFSELIAPHDQYSNLGIDDDSHRVVYKGFFKAHIDHEIISDIRCSTNVHCSRL